MPDNQEIPFARRVYKVVERIPIGRVTTYGAIARALGSPRSARMVGWAMRSLVEGHELPAHRVVNRNGFLSGGWYFGHPEIMRGRLEDEGVDVSEDYIVKLKLYFWDPAGDPMLDEFIVPNY